MPRSEVLVWPLSFGTAAACLADLGWRPIPIQPDTKRPAICGWQHANAAPWPSNELAMLSACFGARAIGLAVQPDIVVVDMDEDRPTQAAALARAADQHLGETPLVRIGRAPKQLRIYRSSGQIRSLRRYKLDLFSGTGQFVAFAVHGATGRPYTWPIVSPLDLPVTAPDIPLVSRRPIERFLTEAAEIIGGPPRGTRRRGACGTTGIGEQLRMLVARLGWRSAAIRVLKTATKGCRHNTMIAVLASAAAHGVPEDQVVVLFAHHFAGWDGVTPEAFKQALIWAYSRSSKPADPRLGHVEWACLAVTP